MKIVRATCTTGAAGGEGDALYSSLFTLEDDGAALGVRPPVRKPIRGAKRPARPVRRECWPPV